MALKRLHRELNYIHSDTLDTISLCPIDEEDLFTWQAIIMGCLKEEMNHQSNPKLNTKHRDSQKKKA